MIVHSLLRAARQVETVSDLLLQTGIRSFSELLLMGSAEDVRNTALVTLAKRNGVSVDVLAALAPRELRARLAAVGNDQGVKVGFFDLVEVRCRATCTLYSKILALEYILSLLEISFLPFSFLFLSQLETHHTRRVLEITTGRRCFFQARVEDVARGTVGSAVEETPPLQLTTLGGSQSCSGVFFWGCLRRVKFAQVWSRSLQMCGVNRRSSSVKLLLKISSFDQLPRRMSCDSSLE